MKKINSPNEPISTYEPWVVPEFLISFFKEIDEELRHKNRFSIPQKQKGYLTNFIHRKINHGCKKISSETVLYRSRIHDYGKNDLYRKKEMGAPPNEKAASGRMNPEGIPYLYLANSISTAIAETRPWKGALLSVGKFKTTRDLNIVSFHTNLETNDLIDQNTRQQMIFDLILQVLYFSIPAHGNDKFSYLASQYIAEQFKQKDIDGLEYPSVLSEGGRNTVLFDINAAKCISVTGHEIENVSYSFDKWNPQKKP